MSKIDVHHHVYPPCYTKALENSGGDPSGWFVPQWTVAADQDISKAVGNKTAILSNTAPGACIVQDSHAAASLAREMNEYSAELRDQHPDSYGLFGSLPDLLDTKSCLDEISYCFDQLKADGITLFTRYGAGHQYLGDPAFRPIWAALDERDAVVFIHPTHPVDTTLINKALPQPMFDYCHETGRTAIDMIVNNVVRDFPRCRVILSHGGGTLPYLVGRVSGALPYTPFSVGKSTEEIMSDARHFYYDTALTSNAGPLKALFELVGTERVLFGTDFPNAPNESIKYFTKLLSEFDLTDDERDAIFYGNALKLFPRLGFGDKGGQVEA